MVATSSPPRSLIATHGSFNRIYQVAPTCKSIAHLMHHSTGMNLHRQWHLDPCDRTNIIYTQGDHAVYDICYFTSYIVLLAGQVSFKNCIKGSHRDRASEKRKKVHIGWLKTWTLATVRQFSRKRV